MREVHLKCIVYEYDSIEELPDIEQDLIRQAGESALRAWSPYSGFRVGAALLLDNGEVISGNNQENAAFPSGNCAERVALFYAISRFPESAPLVLAVTSLKKNGEITDYPVYPCGACRQVILESEKRYSKMHRLIFHGRKKTEVVNSVRDILPLCFDRDSLRTDR